MDDPGKTEDHAVNYFVRGHAFDLVRAMPATSSFSDTYAHGARTEQLAVERGQRLLRLALGRELDEGEAAGTLGVAVERNVDALDLAPILLEHLAQRGLVDVVGEIPDVESSAHSWCGKDWPGATAPVPRDDTDPGDAGKPPPRIVGGGERTRRHPVSWGRARLAPSTP